MKTDETLVKQLILSLSGESEPESFVFLQAMHYCEIRYGKKVKTGNEPELLELCATAYLYFKELRDFLKNEQTEVSELSLGELTVKQDPSLRISFVRKMFRNALKKAEESGLLKTKDNFLFLGVIA